MLFFIISDTEGVRVLICPAIFGHWIGFCGRCFNHQAGVMPVYWLMLLPFFFVVDVIATVMYFIGRCYCHILVGWCYCHSWYVIRLVADVVATVAVVFATCGKDVSFYGRCYCHLCWLMLLPCLCVAVFCGKCYCHYGWWHCHLWEWCDWQMLFPRVADGIIPTSGKNDSHSGNNICHQPNNIPTMAITSANKIHNSGNNIYHKKEWQQHQPIYRHNACLVVKTSTTKTNPMSKNCRTYQHSDTLSVGYNKE